VKDAEATIVKSSEATKTLVVLVLGGYLPIRLNPCWYLREGFRLEACFNSFFYKFEPRRVGHHYSN